MTTPTDQECCLYWHWAADGTLLYVGISLWPLMRQGAHRKGSPWARQIASITMDWFASQQEALDAERKAIIECRPLHNVQHNGAVRRRGTKPSAPLPAAVQRDTLWRKWESSL